MRLRRIAPLFALLAVTAQAQQSPGADPQQLFREAESELSAGNSAQASALEAKARTALGSDNAVLATLRARIALAQERYFVAEDEIASARRFEMSDGLRAQLGRLDAQTEASIARIMRTELQRVNKRLDSLEGTFTFDWIDQQRSWKKTRKVRQGVSISLNSSETEGSRCKLSTRTWWTDERKLKKKSKWWHSHSRAEIGGWKDLPIGSQIIVGFAPIAGMEGKLFQGYPWFTVRRPNRTFLKFNASGYTKKGDRPKGHDRNQSGTVAAFPFALERSRTPNYSKNEMASIFRDLAQVCGGSFRLG